MQINPTPPEPTQPPVPAGRGRVTPIKSFENLPPEVVAIILTNIKSPTAILSYLRRIQPLNEKSFKILTSTVLKRTKLDSEDIGELLNLRKNILQQEPPEKPPETLEESLDQLSLGKRTFEYISTEDPTSREKEHQASWSNRLAKELQSVELLQKLNVVEIEANPNLTEEELIALIERCPHLKTLNLSKYAEKTTDDLLRRIIEMRPNLEALILKGCKKITNVGLTSIANGCKQLKVLDLSIIGSVTDDLLRRIIEKQPNLETLILEVCTKITDVGVTSIANSCKKLKVLDLSVCENVTDNGLKTLAESCKDLQTIILSVCLKITDDGLIPLAQNCRDLRVVNLYHCTKITDKGLKELAKCTHLRSLTIEVCWRTTDEGLKAFSGSTELELLNIAQCGQITDAGLEEIVKNCGKLKVLALGKKITNAGLKLVGKYCTDLRTLVLRDNDNVTDEGLGFVVSGCSILNRLSLIRCYHVSPGIDEDMPKRITFTDTSSEHASTL